MAESELSPMILDFLMKIPPFNLIPEDRWESLKTQTQMAIFPEGASIYRQGQSNIKALSIIYKGSVEKFFERPNGQRVYRETFGEGDSFGAVSILLNNLKAIRSVRTLSTTTLLNIPIPIFQQICRDHEAVYEFFIQQFGKRMLHSGYASELQKNARTDQSFQGSDLIFQLEVGELFSRNINACIEGSTMQEAAAQMSRRRRSYIMVRSSEGEYIGIITDQLLRNEVLAKGLPYDTPVGAIMRGPIYSIDNKAFGYEAILLMFRRKVNYLLVKEEDKVVGIVGLGRLLNSQGKSPFLFIQSIRNNDEDHFLRRKWNEVPELVDNLLERGTRPEIVNQIISSVSDAITQTVIRKAIQRLGDPPARFVFMALGSEGRREQTLKTDQDNAIIYEDLPEEEEAEASQYFLRLGQEISDKLNLAGFAYCEGNLMASNPVWNRPLRDWKQYYENWISQPMGEKALIASVFFDAKAIHGDFSLMKELLAFTREILKKSGSSFLGQLARHSLVNRPPLGWFGSFQETTSDDRKGINIKRAMQNITDYARIYALREQLPVTNTGERLRLMTHANVLIEREFTELHQAYYFMMRLRLSHQIQQIMEGQSPDNLIPPDSLSKIEKVTLREIFKVVEKYQKRLSTIYLGY